MDNSTLPYDIARCPGTTHQNCQDCRRRETGRPEWQTFIAPAIAIDGICENYIAQDHPWKKTTQIKKRLYRSIA